MRKLITYLQRIFMLAIIASTMLACSDGDSINIDQPTEGAVRLRIAVGASGDVLSASVPQGGEIGDGLEPGQHHENDINSLSLFTYRGSMNGDGSTPVKLVAYLTDLNLTTEQAKFVDGYYVHEVRVDDKFINGYEYSGADKFIVVTNLYAIHATTLGELRDAYVTQTVNKVASGELMSGCNNFVMSNEDESRVIDGSGSVNDPHIISVNVERVTARVDFIVDGSTVDGANLRYDAIDGTNNEKVADVYVSHVRVFNGMRGASYLIKRLADGEGTTPLYLADEFKPATRLVVEPHTWQKGSVTSAVLGEWFGETAIASAQAGGDSWFRDGDRVHVDARTQGNDGFGTSTSTDAQGNNYYLVDYVNENTMSPQNTNGDVTTGVMLRAIYKPVKVYGSLDDKGVPVLDNTYSYGKSFWRYRPVNTTYDETQAIYFSSAKVANDYLKAHPEQTAEVTEFPNALCYYPVFLRHDNTVATPLIHTMEFGIVRNNIYRLKVSFTGPGYNTITTEVDPEGIRPFIYVRKWYKILHPEIEI